MLAQVRDDGLPAVDIAQNDAPRGAPKCRDCLVIRRKKLTDCDHVHHGLGRMDVRRVQQSTLLECRPHRRDSRFTPFGLRDGPELIAFRARNQFDETKISTLKRPGGAGRSRNETRFLTAQERGRSRLAARPMSTARGEVGLSLPTGSWAVSVGITSGPAQSAQAVFHLVDLASESRHCQVHVMA